MSFADVAVWDVLNAFVTYIEPATLAGFTRVQAFYDAFAAKPQVAKHIASRPA
jgi:hypothetical protein